MTYSHIGNNLDEQSNGYINEEKGDKWKEVCKTNKINWLTNKIIELDAKFFTLFLIRVCKPKILINHFRLVCVLEEKRGVTNC